jgi:hypothetical protein
MFYPTGLYILLVVLLLALGVIFLIVVIRKARKSPAPPEAGQAAAGGGDPAQLSLNASSVGLKLSFSKAMRRIIRAYGKNSRYMVPWYLMLGETQSGKTTLLGNTGMELLSNAPDEQQTGVKQGLNWFLFHQGIVLDVTGDFVLRADGATSNVKGWNYFTKLLRRQRPERPLDGIILTIPCSDLKGTASQSAEFKFKLEQKAQYLYSKLVDAQQRLGLSFPVYVLITKCDEVTGFKSLCRAIPERRDEMFGWSSPYTRDTAYRTEWVTEAFQNLHSYLFELQMEVFAQHDRDMDSDESDEFFMLPTEIGWMRAPLQIYLDQIFKESAYHDSFFLRGIYFCGDGAGEVPAATAATVVVKPAEQKIDWRRQPPGSSQALVATVAVATTAPPPEKKHAFLEHLFEKKIFQEVLLARPINRTSLSRNRLVLVAQVLSLAIPIIGVLGILATYPALRDREATYNNYLTREEQDLKAVKAERAGALIDDQARNRESLLFEAMANMSGKSLVSPFIPGSWFSHVNEQSGNSISGSYQFAIYDTLRLRLDCRTESRLASTASACYTPVTTSTQTPFLTNCAPENDQTSNNVNTFIESFNELLLNRARYNRLIMDDGGNLEDLKKLLVYFNHAPLPVNFDTHNALFLQALRTAQRPTLQATDKSVYDRAACKVEGMINDIYAQTFKGGGVTFTHLGDIAKTENLLSRPENSWLANRFFDDSSPFVGMTFSAGVSELKRALNDLSNERQPPPEAGTQTPAPPPEVSRQHAHQTREALIWDKATLEQAIASYDKYASFVDNNFYDRRQTLDRDVKQVKLGELRRSLAYFVPRALRYQLPVRSPGETAQRASLRLEIKSLEESQDLLSKLLDICRLTGIDVRLRKILTNQTTLLMKAIDDEFFSAGFYTMTRENLYRWTLNKQFHSYIAFGTANPDELEVYLATQREGIAELAQQFAEPVLNFMAAQNITPQSSVDWKQILDQLDKYGAKKPGNTVSLLENFIRAEMDSVKLDNCAVIISGSSLEPLDFFIRRRNALRQPFYQRCQQLALEEMLRLRRIELDEARAAREKKEDEFYNALGSYWNIQKAFDQNLAGKFPFSDLPQAEPFGEATPDEIAAFFKVFTDNKDAAIKILKEAPGYGISNTEALLFLKRMETISVLFAAFLDKKQQFPAFDFNLRFRANDPTLVENKPANAANQIIDWTFTVAGKRFLYREQDEKPPEGIWGYGNPLSLSLRWANDSPTIPSAVFPAQAHMKLEGQTVTLRYENNWSLLLLLLRYKGQSEDFKQGVDVKPYTIKLTVPTQPNPKLSNVLQRAQPPEIKTTFVDVLMRVSLLAPGKKDPLILPDVFPTRAPQLTNRSPVTQQSSEDRSN